MHDAHAPLWRNKIFLPVLQKKPEAAIALPTLLPCSGFALPEKARRHSAYPVKHTPTAEDVFYDGTHRIAIAFLKDGKNGRIFLQAQQCLTLYGYSKSPALYKRAGPLHWYRRISFKRYLQGRLLPRFAPLLDLSILLITKIAIDFDKDGKNGCQNSKFGRLF